MKQRRPEKRKSSVLYIAFLGFVGLLLEALGVWLLFAWFSAVPRSVEDPKLLIGSILAIAGFVLLTRWLAAVVKALVR